MFFLQGAEKPLYLKKKLKKLKPDFEVFPLYLKKKIKKIKFWGSQEISLGPPPREISWDPPKFYFFIFDFQIQGGNLKLWL